MLDGRAGGSLRRAARQARWPLAAGAALTAILFVVFGTGFGTGGDSEHANPFLAAVRASDPWQPAHLVLRDLDAVAIQSCAATAALAKAPDEASQARWRGRQETLAARYLALAVKYDAAAGEFPRGGAGRPDGLPPYAPTLDEARGRACVNLSPFAQRPKLPLEWPRHLTLDELDIAAEAAGWPNAPGWWPEMRKIILCETRTLDRLAHNTSDPNGGSYGLAQLNGPMHFERAGEDFGQRFDPVVNLRTALWLRTARGHFSGFGGWGVCAALSGVR
ncbi:MAG: hypothetical protein ACR2NO_00900 [Chloroflexota bacterium]